MSPRHGVTTNCIRGHHTLRACSCASSHRAYLYATHFMSIPLSPALVGGPQRARGHVVGGVSRCLYWGLLPLSHGIPPSVRVVTRWFPALMFVTRCLCTLPRGPDCACSVLHVLPLYTGALWLVCRVRLYLGAVQLRVHLCVHDGDGLEADGLGPKVCVASSYVSFQTSRGFVFTPCLQSFDFGTIGEIWGYIGVGFLH